MRAALLVLLAFCLTATGTTLLAPIAGATSECVSPALDPGGVVPACQDPYDMACASSSYCVPWPCYTCMPW